MTDVSPKEVTDTGTTEDDYVDLVFDMRARKALTIHLKNTGGANTMTYRVDGYANYGGTIAKEEVAAADAAPAGIVQIAITKKLAQVTLQVKSKVAGNPTTYEYEAISAVF